MIEANPWAEADPGAEANAAAEANPANTVAAGLNAAAGWIDRLDAEVLLAHVIGVPRLELLLDLDRLFVGAVEYAALVKRRAKGEPVAYLTGRREFWSLDLVVTPDVLIPRPDSETLIEAAIDHFAGMPGPARVLDLGTGSGALLLAALSEWPAATGVGIDASAAALAVAADNACRLGFDRASFVHGDWTAAAGAFDLILANPPYIANGYALPRDVSDWEPPAALFGGPSGLDEHRRVAPVIAEHLAAGGVGCVEIGQYQGARVAAMYEELGLSVAGRPDLVGITRALVVTN